MSACICTKRGFLLSPPHRNSVVMSCPAACIASKICLVPNFKKGGRNRTRWAQESSHRNSTTPAWQRHPHQNLPFALCNSTWKSTSVKRFQFWSQIAKQNKKRTANTKLCFLSFQQKGKPEEFCIGLTISLGLCPMQNKMFHFMARLIETSRTQAYFKLFIQSETQIRMTEVNALPFSKKNLFSFYLLCFPPHWSQPSPYFPFARIFSVSLTNYLTKNNS